MTEAQIKYDDETIKEIKKKIAHAIQSNDTIDDQWAIASLQYCVVLIEQLRDEIDSVWYMLEEMQKSVWTSEHSSALNKSIDQRLAILKLMHANKGEA